METLQVDLRDKSSLVRFPRFFPSEKARALAGALGIGRQNTGARGAASGGGGLVVRRVADIFCGDTGKLF